MNKTLPSNANRLASPGSIMFKGLVVFFMIIGWGSTTAFSQGLRFKNPILELGTAGQDGAVYRFPAITTGVDGLIKIVKRSDANVQVVNIDISSTGFDNAFQPQVSYQNGTATAAADWWMEFEISFVQSTSSSLVKLDEFNLSGVDIDGNNDKLSEYMSLYDLKSYILEQNSVLKVTNVFEVVKKTNTVVGKRFDAPTANFLNIDTLATVVMVTANYKKIETFRVRTGAVASGPTGATDRMYSFNFQSFKYNAPVQSNLPVRLNYFTASVQNKNSLLNWESSLELSFDHYVVQRSFDGRSFEDIKIIKAQTGSSVRKQYSVLDDVSQCKDAVVYYRLKMVDIDLKYEYSPVRMIRTNTGSQQLEVRVFPNPVQSTMKISTPQSFQNKEVNYTIIDLHGRIIRSVTIARAGQYQDFSISEFQAGIYTVRVSNEGTQVTSRFVKS